MDSQTPLQASHLDVRIDSKTYPIALRTVKAEDAFSYAQLLFSKDHTSETSPETVDTAKGLKIIEAHREFMSVPTVLGPDGHVVSGPRKVNMVVVLKSPDGQQETVIGCGGYGAIKDWERDGKPVRAGDAGVLIDKVHRGKGYAVEAMKLAVDWAFIPVSEGGPQMDIVTITTVSTNDAMIKLTEDKLSLKGKGVRRPGEFDPFEIYWELRQDDWEHAKST